MAERASELLPTTALGQYEIRSRIGSGGMGDVYDAMHTGLNRRVAIKTLRRRYLDDDTVVTRFLREGQLASRIRHPNIVDVTDVGMIGGLPCLVMEHLEGEPLGAVIKRGGALPVTTAVDLLLPIVAAVDFAHERGVLHRDVKPSNIFLARSWNGDITPKILDFGISKLVDESQQAALTTDSAFVGTPHYASPEAMRAEKTTDGRSDQYSMGVVFYEAVTGAKPFHSQGGNFVALAMAICEGQFRPPRQVKPDLPPALEAVILRAMRLRSDERYPSMRALGEALLPFASDRARMIWTPAFAAPSGARTSATPQEGTKVMLWPSSGHLPGATPIGFPGGTPHSGMHAMNVHGPATPHAGSSDGTPSHTLGGGSFPGPVPQKKSSITGLAVGIGFFAVVLAVSGIAFVKLTGGHPASAGTADPTASAAPPLVTSTAPTSYEVAITLTPESATLELDGLPAGSGALTRTFPRDGRQHALRASAPGYETFFMTFDGDRTPPQSIALRPLAQGAQGTPTSTSKSGTHATPGGGSTKGAGTGKIPDNRPRTDNIDPWE